MEINEGVATFSINLTGAKTGDTYLGGYKVKCMLSPLEEIKADRTYREILGTNSHLAQEYVRRLAFALSQLDQRIIECPPFWENNTLGGGHVKDDNVVLEVFDKACEAQEKYLDGVKAEKKEREERIAEMIRKSQIEREPEAEKIKDHEEPDEVEID